MAYALLAAAAFEIVLLHPGAGMTLDETQAEVKLDEFRDAFPDADRGMRTAVERAYREARGDILP